MKPLISNPEMRIHSCLLIISLLVYLAATSTPIVSAQKQCSQPGSGPLPLGSSMMRIRAYAGTEINKNNCIDNGGVTSSTTILITISGIIQDINAGRLQCTLDGQQYPSCGYSNELSVSTPGTHTFNATVLDAQTKQPIQDKSQTFTWTLTGSNQ